MEETKYHWYKPRKNNRAYPSNAGGSIYGVYFCEGEVDPNELFRLDLLELGYMTRSEMLHNQRLPEFEIISKEQLKIHNGGTTFEKSY